MRVQSVKNQYRGINAHLHSLYQAEGGWGGFHTQHITYLANAIAAQVRPMGYRVGVEESLQIRRIDGIDTRPRPDAIIYDPIRPQSTPTPVLEQALSLHRLLDPHQLSEKPFRSIVIYDIYDVQPLQPERGHPVVWIELLSPSNKGKSDDAEVYRAKRMDALVSGLVFVEIDNLNESIPTFPTIADYASHADNSFPYRVIVLDPRPDVERGRAWVTQFSVDSPITTMHIPLNGSDTLTFDFGIPYQRTFEEGFFGDFVDYSELPHNFDRYSPDDQLRIARRMLAVLQAYRQGIDLETAPFAVDERISLEDALSEIERYKNSG